MSFTLPDLVIEGAIRKGFDFLRENAGADGNTLVLNAAAVDIPPTVTGMVFESGVTSNSSGTGIIATLLIPNVGSLESAVNNQFIEYTDNTGRLFRLTPGAAVSTTAQSSNSTTSFTLVGTLSGFRNVELNNGILAVPLEVESSSILANYVAIASPTTNTVSWTMSGERGTDEVIGAGGEILNMLFDFRTGSDSIDGGLDSVISRKYSLEPLRLREFFRRNQIAIVQSFSDVQAHLPCISIQLANDGEDQGLALTDDFGGIDGTFDSDVPARDRLGRDENTIHANTTINVGIHTKEQLLTKYLYHITKYFVLSAKEDLIRQNFIIATFKGSDFMRDASWQGDHVYTRFLNISGKTEDSWVNLDELVVALEEVGVQVFVPATPNAPATTQANSGRFVSGSAIFSNISTTNARLQLPNSVYFPDMGMAVLIQRDGTGNQRFQSTTAFSYTNNNDTNILTAANVNPPSGMTFETITTGDLVDQRYVEIQDSAGLTVPVSSIPSFSTTPDDGLSMSQSRQNINDADGVIHRSNEVENN